MVGALAGLLIASGCSDDDEVVTDPTDEFDVTLEFSDATASVGSPVVEPYASVDGQTSIKARLLITATKTIRRIYVTQNVAGQGDEPYDLRAAGLSNKTTKPDGSIDVESDAQPLDYTLTLPIPTGVGTNGTVVYKIWATNGRGDYRDPSNSLAAGIGEIDITVGTGANPAAPVKEFTAKMFEAPLGDGTSDSFISLLDGQLYQIADGTEYAKLWDFGYYYGNTGLASLASTFDYPKAIVDVPTVSGTAETELNEAYFKLSTSFDATGFDNVSVSGDLNSISSSSAQTITQLNVGDIVEFVDNYGKKGLIEIVAIVAGQGSTGSMTINVKVQP